MITYSRRARLISHMKSMCGDRTRVRETYAGTDEK